ncbi:MULTISPECIES: hypothetical protein [unclassified Paraburkholderia]|uniref:hypothetical protein n=1 Tax=unclassified Paraburkholderia TaxID=2615204 RepID=UPI002AB1C3EC|nr:MULTISPECIES: hypothetical protein [unclassified Paraburkholderia]
MKYLASVFAALAAAVAIGSPLAHAQSASDAASSQQECSIGRASGVAGAAASMREYLALPERDRYRYFADHQIDCSVGDDGRATGCVGLVNLRNDKVSVYDDSDPVTTTVVARIELEHGTYPLIIVVRKQDIKCDD